jgi:D-galactarolactone cycloisomerase
LLASLASSSGALWLQPIQAAARDIGSVRIKGLEVFTIKLPASSDQVASGVMNQYDVARIETDTGVRGYSFALPLTARPVTNEKRGWAFDFELPPRKYLDSVVRLALIGKDLFAIPDLLKAGLAEWGGIEHALWDAIGKIARQPVYRLLGGSKTNIKAYVTCVWKGKEDQSDVPYDHQVSTAVQLKKAGFKAMKMRAWRPRPLDDAEACKEIRSAVGPDFALMFDRTAHHSGWVWDFDTGLRVAREMEKHGAYWLEEPFDRNDFESPARLARDVDIYITGGEAYQGLSAYRECLKHDTYDILQPDGVIAGGILNVCKIAAMAEGFQKRVVLHGTMGLSLAGWLHANAAVGSEWQELAIITPPLLPEDQWRPALHILNSGSVFSIKDGHILVPQGPGLGLDINEEAVERYRV